MSVLANKLEFHRGLSTGLFPIVIHTMTIERMTTVWEERGPGEALQQAAGSLVVGALCCDDRAAADRPGPARERGRGHQPAQRRVHAGAQPA